MVAGNAQVQALTKLLRNNGFSTFLYRVISFEALRVCTNELVDGWILYIDCY